MHGPLTRIRQYNSHKNREPGCIGGQALCFVWLWRRIPLSAQFLFVVFLIEQIIVGEA